jgi:hypothetical protein
MMMMIIIIICLLLWSGWRNCVNEILITISINADRHLINDLSINILASFTLACVDRKFSLLFFLFFFFIAKWQTFLKKENVGEFIMQHC